MICPICKEETGVVQGRFVHHGDCAGGFALVEIADTRMESRYTGPTDTCPHPERWHSADWDSAEEEVSALVGALVTALRPSLVVETGSAFGQTAHAIGTALAGTGGVLHTIEVNPERADITRKRCEGLSVVVEQMSSLDWTPPGEIGFAWFDSLLPLRVPEFRRYHEHFTPGALVGFHDTAPHFDLWPAIEQLEADGLLLPIRLPTPRGMVLAEVVG